MWEIADGKGWVPNLGPGSVLFVLGASMVPPRPRLKPWVVMEVVRHRLGFGCRRQLEYRLVQGLMEAFCARTVAR